MKTSKDLFIVQREFDMRRDEKKKQHYRAINLMDELNKRITKKKK